MCRQRIRMGVVCRPVLAVMLLLPSLARSQQDTPAPLNWGSHSASAIDLSRFLNPPAGQSGFVRADREHLVDGNGKRVRLWGVNLGGPACFPTHEQAEALADSFARMGFNCVRFHGLDSNWGRSSIDRSGGDTLSLNENNLERFDYLFDQLRRRGIYGNINLNTFRTYGVDDGVPDPGDLGLGKWATHFYPRLVELQEKYASDLLTHVNRYTGHSYANDPSVLVVEIVNENSLIEGWFQGKLIGVNDGSGDTWSPLPKVYAEELNRQFNEWLAEHRTPEQLARLRGEAGGKENAPLTLLRPDQFRTVSGDRFAADYEFIVSTEHTYLSRMKKLIKNDLGLKSMLIGDADHNDSINGYPHIINNEMFDYLDGHGYWQHPSIGAVTRTGNNPMVNDPGDSTIVQFARTPMVGKPFVVSETNHPYPHVYAVEGIPLMTTYAMLQDWDGVLFHEWGDGTYHPSSSIPQNGWFQLSRDPLKIAELVLSGLLWHRNDIRPANQLIIRESTLPELRQNSRVEPWRHRPFFDDAFPKTLPLLHRTRWRLLETPTQANYPADPGITDLESDTGQLRWHGADRDRGRVVIDAPRVQGFVGYQRDGKNRGYAGTELLSADLRNEFAAVMLASLDDQPIRFSKRMLLLVADRSANHDLTWQEDFETVANWGEGPVVIRGVEGVIRIAGWDASPTPRVTVLDSLGCITDETWPVEYRGGRWHITAGSPPALIALIER